MDIENPQLDEDSRSIGFFFMDEGSEDKNKNTIKPKFKDDTSFSIISRSKAIKKHHSFFQKPDMNKRKIIDLNFFQNELEYDAFDYKNFVKIDVSDEKNEEDIRGQKFIQEKKNEIKSISFQELLDSLQNLGLDKSFQLIFKYFEEIKRDLVVGNYFLKGDRNKLIKIIENRVFFPFKDSILSFKKNLPLFFLNICEKVLENLNNLHSKELCYLDLKPENIRLNSVLDGILLDQNFSLPAIDINKEKANSIITLQYSDPEISNENPVIKDGRRCDSFSFSKIIQSIINVWSALNYDDKNNHVIDFLKKIQTLLLIKKTPIYKVINLIKVFKLNNLQNNLSDSNFDENLFLSLFIHKHLFDIETINSDNHNISQKNNYYLDQSNYLNQNACLSFMSINNHSDICEKYFNHILDIKSTLSDYPIFYFSVYGQKNITFPRLLQILGQHYYYLNRYFEACCLLRSSLKIYEKEMAESNTKNHESFFENCVMLAKAYLFNEEWVNFEQVKSKMKSYLESNNCEDYRFSLVQAYEEGKKGNMNKRKELFMNCLTKLKQKNPNDRNIVEITDSILENANEKEIEECLCDMEKRFNDPFSLATIYKRKMIAAYSYDNENKAEENFEKVKKIYSQIGIRTNHPFIYYMNYFRCSLIVKFKQHQWNISNVFKENDEKFKFEQDYRLDDKGREYNMRLKASLDTYDIEIESLRKKTQEFLKSMKNDVIRGYTYLNVASLLEKNGSYQESIGNSEKSKEFWQESIENFRKSREYYSKRYGECHDFTIWNDTLKAEILFKLKDYNEAFKVIEKPYQEYPKIYGPNHNRVKKTVEVYQKIKKEIEKMGTFEINDYLI